MRKFIKLKDIVRDAGTQIRVLIDDGDVEDYAEKHKAKVKFPAIDVFTDDEKYLLADGWHRVLGAERAGLTQIEAEVHKGNRLDCIKFALSANAHHGIRRTNADKRHAVEIALKEFPSLSNEAIAEICEVGETLVRSVRQVVRSALSGPGTHPPVPEKRIGRDGKSYPAPPSRPPSRPPSKPPERPSSPPPNAKKNPPPPSSPAKKDEPKVLDKTGYPIPTKILPLWNRGHEAQGVLNSISGIRSALRHAQDDKDLLFREVNFSSVLAHLDQAYSDCKTAVPYAVCTCEGHHPEDCTFCKGRGFLSEHRYKTCATKEIKEIREKLTKQK